MRIIHKFKYKNKFFRAGELTVGAYLASLEDFNFFVDTILSEFNKEKPVLDQDFLKAFLNIIFDKQKDMQIFPKKKGTPEDFHIMVGIFMRNMNQWYSDVCDMPMRMFDKFVTDMVCILDPETYDPERHNKTPDKKKIKDTFGGKTEIKS